MASWKAERQENRRAQRQEAPQTPWPGTQDPEHIYPVGKIQAEKTPGTQCPRDCLDIAHPGATQGWESRRDLAQSPETHPDASFPLS